MGVYIKLDMVKKMKMETFDQSIDVVFVVDDWMDRWMKILKGEDSIETNRKKDKTMSNTNINQVSWSRCCWLMN